MSILKQGLIVAVLVVVAFAGWLRFWPDAPGVAAAYGVPQPVIRLVAGEAVSANQGGGQGAARRGPRPALVIVSAVGQAAINDRISAIGDGEAARSVTVVPWSEGVIEAVLVEAGDRVSAGDTLARLDAAAEEIARDQAALAVTIAKDQVTRYERLVETRTITQVQLTEARNEYENAKLDLRDAQLELDRRAVVAPIAGVVDIVPVETGDYVTDQTAMATIDDRSAILLDFWAPERFAPLIVAGQPVEATAIALPGRRFSGEVEAVSSRIDRNSRTFQVRARLDNQADLLRSGMSFRVNLKFEGEAYPAVDPLAVQWSSDGPYVWKAVDEKAVRVSVDIVQRNSDYILVAGELAPGDTVVIEGLQSLRPGSALTIARRSTAPTAQGG